MAEFAYEIAVTGERSQQAAVETWFEGAAPAWRALPGLTAIDLYVPVAGATHDPYVDDGIGPLLIAMLHFPSAETMSDAISTAAFSDSVYRHPDSVALTGSPFERRLYPIDGKPAPLTAPFSYVVRYHRPAVDEAEFVSHYLADHPPLLAKFPAIRSVLCYLPLDRLARVLPTADYMLGNEVAFDSPEAFNAAMASPVRHELRAHFRSFPTFTGRNTHYPMIRRQLAGSRT